MDTAIAAVLWAALILVVPISLIIWKYGIAGDARTLIQGFLVLFGAALASGLYLAIKLKLGREPDFFEKFWIALPLLASFVVSGRCVFVRLANLFFLMRRRPSLPGSK